MASCSVKAQRQFLPLPSPLHFKYTKRLTTTTVTTASNFDLTSGKFNAVKIFDTVKGGRSVNCEIINLQYLVAAP